ncbi:MAG: transcriptional regulator, ArsR family [Candidatus Parvarchaeum acidiphilum ARMAN-4]|jgi:ArsR family transcriptional regulator|uniref:Transcriptional regulator, ArsR family n=1 Tax=Candidatus Parvarchaeum acidiphilum ARMAN-4 TaxID=662760 RepID=D2EFM7_PARA4|nr:MAG: transcriptional regulator, ArsR family [Candidatus Parvarchaeum acidiphilum ARMAN-4]
MKNVTSLFFEAFSNKNRFEILMQLRNKELCAGELQQKLKIEQTNLSHDLKCLLNCRFISVRKDGRKRIYRINNETKELVDEVANHIKNYEVYLKKCGILKEEQNGRI